MAWLWAEFIETIKCCERMAALFSRLNAFIWMNAFFFFFQGSFFILRIFEFLMFSLLSTYALDSVLFFSYFQKSHVVSKQTTAFIKVPFEISVEK